MSFDISWAFNAGSTDDRPVENFLETLRNVLNTHISSVLLKDNDGNIVQSVHIDRICIDKSDMYNEPPLKLELSDIKWPWNCFYDISTSDKPPMSHAGDLQAFSLAPTRDTSYSSVYASLILPSTPTSTISTRGQNSIVTTTAISRVSYGNTYSPMSNNPNSIRRSFTSTATKPYQIDPSSNYSTVPHPSASVNDIQIELDIDIHAPLEITLEAVLQLNYPLQSFLSLPVQICIQRVGFQGKLLLAYVQEDLCISIIPSKSNNAEEPQPFILDIPMDVNLGDLNQAPMLKHVEKARKFLMEFFSGLLCQDLVFPNFYRFHVSEPQSHEVINRD
jgi:hypothetical protein